MKDSTKLNLGCGDLVFDDYINYDLHNANADIQGDARKLPFDNESMDEILASHLLEHFDFQEGMRVLLEWKRVLRKGGLLALELPNLLEACRVFVEQPNMRIPLYAQIFGNPWLQGHTHLFGFTPEQIVWNLEKTGFINIQRKPPLRYQDLGNLVMRWECIKA